MLTQTDFARFLILTTPATLHLIKKTRDFFRNDIFPLLRQDYRDEWGNFPLCCSDDSLFVISWGKMNSEVEFKLKAFTQPRTFKVAKRKNGFRVR